MPRLQDVTSHPRFNPNMSSTYSSNGQIFSAQHGSGSLSGVYGYDTEEVRFVGIMGLAYRALAEDRGITALQGMLQAGLFSSQVFSFYLGRSSSLATGAQADQYGQFIVDYNNVQNLPTLTFLISRVRLSLPYHSFLFTENGVCALGVQATYLPSSSGQPLWILGVVFLKSYYSIFDIGNNRVGCATAA
ncbi:PGC [Vulpes lagopus]